MFPSLDVGPPYGYTTWLNPIDPVAPDVTTFGGANSQCVYVPRYRIFSLYTAIVYTSLWDA